MQRTAVINAVGLTRSLIGAHTPRLAAFLAAGRAADIKPVLPAVTCSVQSTYLTGTWPSEHGIVANGWLFRDEWEVKLWRQSNRLVHGKKVWEIARERNPAFTCANLFWWYNMHSTADFAVTPRPMYLADGRKLPDIWTHPAPLREALQRKLGQFPLFKFWGPMTSIDSTRWIARAAMEIEQAHAPTLSLVYLPHLDYAFQRHGPDLGKVAPDLAELDSVCGELLDFYAKAGIRVIILSEYGIARVDRTVHVNRILREAGLLAVREELGRELLDPGESAAFALADHQLAHVYVNEASALPRVKKILEAAPGVGAVLDEEGKRLAHLDHPRSGELVALAAPGSWFTYYWWQEESKAPDFASTVDIHRKPGYDPVELFINPRLGAAKARIAWKLLKRKMGFRSPLNVIGTDASIVKGSHGLAPASGAEGAMVMAEAGIVDRAQYEPTEVMGLLLKALDLG